jgi:fatty acid desaturase
MTFVAYRALRAALLDPAVYEEVEADASATGPAVALVLLSSVAAGFGASGWSGPSLWTQLAITGIAFATWAAWAVLVLQIGSRWLPGPRTRADTGQLLRTLGFASAPGLLQVFGMLPPLTVAVFVIAWVWMFAAMVVAIRQALDYERTSRAIAVTATALVLVVGLVIVFGWLFGPAAS